MYMRKVFLTLVLMMTTALGFAQRFTDKIDRGLVAVPSATSGNFVSWRVLGEEYYDVTYQSVQLQPLKRQCLQQVSGGGSGAWCGTDQEC